MKKLIIIFCLTISVINLLGQTYSIYPDCAKMGKTMELPSGMENGHAWVNLGLSVWWATCNVGATTSISYGNYYTWSTAKNVAHNQWGGNWRIPTQEELAELINKCTWTWNNGGVTVTSNINGNSIYLPAADHRFMNDAPAYAGSQGFYWSSTVYSSKSSWCLLFTYSSHELHTITNDYTQALPVRPVCPISYDNIDLDTLTISIDGCNKSNKYIQTSGKNVCINVEAGDNAWFDRWEDGNTSNPRTFMLNENQSHTCYYHKLNLMRTNRTLTTMQFAITTTMDTSVYYGGAGILIGDKVYPADKQGIVELTNLEVGKSYDIQPYAIYKGTTFYGTSVTHSTATPSLSCNTFSTQITITLSHISASTDTSVHSLSKGIYYNGKRYEADENDCVTLTGLTPNQKCTLQVYGCYNGNYYYGAEKYITTQAIAPTITTSQVAPTSVYVHGSYTHGDATILGTTLTSYPTNVAPQGDEGCFTGLKPNTSYTFYYSVETQEGGTYTATKTITTPALELTTLTPKVVSAGTAVVAAETNISDYETNVGFEWRKDNAPAGAASKSSPAIICNGVMEGRLLNLGTEWWRVRPYYEDANGKRYYGEEVYIDPIDASYFEPTVHTYALATSPTSNKTQVRGYVMTGTDDVTEQGFEYWFNGKKAPQRMPSATPDSIYRVQASGQVMTAVLEDLAYSTTYTCRAYAIAGGKTYYGEEVQFLTPEDPRPLYTLTISADENGSVNTDVSGQYREGEQVTLTATPDEGYQFKEWSDGTTDNPYTITIMSDTTLTATFEELSEGIDEVTDSQKANVESQKFIQDGVLYIRRNGKTYDAQGRKL